MPGKDGDFKRPAPTSADEIRDDNLRQKSKANPHGLTTTQQALIDKVKEFTTPVHTHIPADFGTPDMAHQLAVTNAASGTVLDARRQALENEGSLKHHHDEDIQRMMEMRALNSPINESVKQAIQFYIDQGVPVPKHILDSIHEFNHQRMVDDHFAHLTQKYSMRNECLKSAPERPKTRQELAADIAHFDHNQRNVAVPSYADYLHWIKEFNHYQNPPQITVAVDFDGTCVFHEYPRVGADVPGAEIVLRHLVEQGAGLILLTMRSGHPLEQAIHWFDQRQIPLYSVQINPLQPNWTISRKCFAHHYIDDANAGCPLRQDAQSGRPFVYWAGIHQYFQQFDWYRTNETLQNRLNLH